MTQPLTPDVRRRVADLLAEYQVPGAAIGVLRDGAITAYATGVRDVASGVPATTETVFQCGSITKTWTALAFLQLAGEGKAGLDRPVRDLLPGFRVADPEVSAAVTPRHLLNHTNGIEEAFGDPGEDDDVYARMAAGVAAAPQVHPLGHTHGYSAALGYALLARIMEVADGRPYDAIMRARIFAPLGLTGTSTRPDLLDPRCAATGHLLRSAGEGPIETPVPYLPRAFGPGGTITTTIHDLLTMASVILGDGRGPGGTRIVPAPLVAEMTGSRVPIPDPYMFGPEWALGLIAADWQGRTVYATDGSTIGQNARLRILPYAGTAVAMLTNAGPRESLYRRVFSEILGALGLVTVPDLPEPDPRLRLDPERYVGVYTRPETRFEVTARDGRLLLTHTLDPMHARFLGKPDRVTYDLLPVSTTHFLVRSTDPLEDTGTAAIYDFTDGPARYLHTNCRVLPRDPSAG